MAIIVYLYVKTNIYKLTSSNKIALPQYTKKYCDKFSKEIVLYNLERKLLPLIKTNKIAPNIDIIKYTRILIHTLVCTYLHTHVYMRMGENRQVNMLQD